MKLSSNVLYAYDLKKIMEFLFNDDGKRNNESEIVETYVSDESNGELILANKQLREVKSGDNSNKSTIKYDLIKFFMEQLNNIYYNKDATYSIGDDLTFNTMLTNGFISEQNTQPTKKGKK